MQRKYELGTRLTYFWHKNEKKISLNSIFVFESLRFRHTYPSFLLSKLPSQIKLIQSVVGVCCQSQCPRVPLPGSQGCKSQGPESQFRSRVSGSQGSVSQVSGSRVSDPDFRLSSIKCDLFWVIFWKQDEK